MNWIMKQLHRETWSPVCGRAFWLGDHRRYWPCFYPTPSWALPAHSRTSRDDRKPLHRRPSITPTSNFVMRPGSSGELHVPAGSECSRRDDRRGEQRHVEMGQEGCGHTATHNGNACFGPANLGSAGFWDSRWAPFCWNYAAGIRRRVYTADWRSRRNAARAGRLLFICGMFAVRHRHGR